MAKKKDDFGMEELVQLTTDFMDRLEKVNKRFERSHHAIGKAVEELDKAKGKWKWYEKLKWVIILVAIIVSYFIMSLIASHYKLCSTSLGLPDELSISLQRAGECKQ